jgi:integrase
VQYRVGKKQRRQTLGRVDTLSLERAREAAQKVLARVHLGDDPQEEKFASRARASTTLSYIAGVYLEHAQAGLKPRTLKEIERSLKVQWKPLADQPAHLITRAMVADRVAALAETSGPYAANRGRAYLSAMFNWAIREGIVGSNPAANTNKARQQEKSRDRVLSDDELRLILSCAGGGEYGTIIHLLALTGQRREEVGAMSWSEVSGSVWTIPPSRTKNSRPHEVPLSLQAVTALDRNLRRADRDLVFGTRAGPFSGWSKAKAALDKRIRDAQLKRDRKAKPMPTWRLHDLRRTVATRMADQGVLPHIIEAVLNHVSGHRAGVAGIYNRSSYLEDKRRALTKWAEFLDNLCGGALTRGGNVVSIRGQ